MTYKKPQDPLTNNGFGIYPLTTADQVILSDGSRLEKNGQISIGGGTVKTVSGVAPDSAGNVALTASDVGALPSGGTALDSSKLGGKAPEYYLQPRNLLDNSDFTNPVNQRGETSVSNNGYFIDRWIIYSQDEANRVTSIDSNGLTTAGGSAVRQVVPAELVPKDKGYTFAVCRSDGYIDFPNTWNDSNGNLICPINGAGTYIWAALYEGSYTADTLPPYVPKGYAAELAECQRYYYTIKSDGSSYAAYATGTMNTERSAYFPIVFPIPMRIAPTLSYSGNFRVYVKGAGRSITDMENNAPSRYSSRIIINNISSGVLGQACELQSSGDGTAFIAFSADL